MAGPPTRILSWQQMVQEADPNWTRLLAQPVIYEFSNGRAFIQPVPAYGPLPTSSLFLTDGFGNILTDGFGNPLTQ